MLIPLQDVMLLYEKVKDELNIDYTSVLIFTSLEADSVCTLRILSRLLKSENIHYKVYPVSSYTDFNLKVDQSKIYEKVKLFFFINCGGITDLTEKWFHNKAEVFLFDVNKPIHHKNIEDGYIRIVDDGHGDLTNHPTTEEMNKYDQIQEYQMEEQQIEDSDDESPKRRARVELVQRLRKHKEVLADKINNYYGRTYFSLPSSYIAYQLASNINKRDNEYLWYAIVGSTAMYLEQRLLKENFEEITKRYGEDMIKRNPETQTREIGNIYRKRDFQFTLLRYWTLYDSILNSTYMLTKFKLWEEKGLKTVQEFILKIGLSLYQAKQLYKFMSKESKKKLSQQIIKYVDEYKILDVTFTSFMRQVDFATNFMASEYAYSILAVLEQPQDKSMSVQSLCQHRTTSFWEAYDLFLANGDTIINKIQQFKNTALFISQEAIQIVQRGHIIKNNSFYFVNIRKDSQLKKRIEHPYILIRLAYLLMEIQRQKKKTTYSKPFIVSLMDVQYETCTVVGVMGQARNSFGTKFLQISEKLHIDVKHDSFLANIMTLPKDNLLEFINQLSKY